MQLFPYQQTGVEFLTSNRVSLLGDEMGLGKTPQGIAATNETWQPVTVLCPAILAEEWRAEFYQWHDVPRSIAVVGDKKDDPENAQFLICSDTRAARPDVYEMLRARKGAHLIIDESHRLKEPTAGRTRAILGEDADGTGGIAETSDTTWFLTGTPCPNNAGELFSMLATGGRFKGGYDQFIRHFCTTRQTKWGFAVTGYKQPDELRALLDGFMLRRTNAVDLPKKHESDMIVQPADCGGIDVLGPLKHALGKSASIIERAAAKGSFAHIESPHVATVRRLIGLAKVQAVARKAAELLQSDPDAKIVIMAMHTLVVDELCRQLQDFGVIKLAGGSTDKKRKTLKDQFQADAETRVAVCQIQAAGVGLTLTAANHLWLMEPSWSPADNEQAKRRIYRIGQKRETFIKTVTLNTSIDHAINGVLRKKKSLIDEIIGDVKPLPKTNTAAEDFAEWV